MADPAPTPSRAPIPCNAPSRVWRVNHSATHLGRALGSLALLSRLEYIAQHSDPSDEETSNDRYAYPLETRRVHRRPARPHHGTARRAQPGRRRSLEDPDGRGTAVQGVRRGGLPPRQDEPSGRRYQRAVATRLVLLDRGATARCLPPALPTLQRQPIPALPGSRRPLRRL